MTVLRLLMVAAFLTALTGLAALPAAAHVELDESQPAADSTVTTQPGRSQVHAPPPRSSRS